VPKQDKGVQVYATWTEDVTETSRPNSRQQRAERDAANSARYLLSSREGGRPRSRPDSDVTPKVSRLDLEARLQQLQARGGCNPERPQAATLSAPGCNPECPRLQPCVLPPQAHEAEAEEEHRGQADAAAARILQLEASLTAAENVMGDAQVHSYVCTTYCGYIIGDGGTRGPRAPTLTPILTLIAGQERGFPRRDQGGGRAGRSQGARAGAGAGGGGGGGEVRRARAGGVGSGGEAR
jgi:hypothetical protein